MKKETFGRTQSGREVFLYQLENKNGCKAAITDYGANLVRLIVPDREGKAEDVVLGFDDVAGYEKNPSFFGALIAPNANRIAGASFNLEGKTYSLKKNNGANNLHTDEEKGSHKRIWSVAAKEQSLCLTLEMADGELGLPGNRRFQVTYSLTEENELRISYRADSDCPTVFNPTNHSYFNLKGHGKGEITDHEITLLASAYTPIDAGLIPTGEIKKVEGTPMDLRNGRRIGERIDEDFEALELAGGYDHNWVTDNCDQRVRRIATVKAPGDLRIMEVYTDLPGVQFYTGNFIDKQKGKEGADYGQRSGFCLETQYFPDSVNKPHFPSVIFSKEKPYTSETIFKFI